jgi:hypothetical protein
MKHPVLGLAEVSSGISMGEAKRPDQISGPLAHVELELVGSAHDAVSIEATDIMGTPPR